MTDRAAIIARILDRVQFVSGAEPAAIANDKPLLDLVDSLDLQEIGFLVETDFGVDLIELDENSTVDSIADAVIAAKGA